VKLTFLGTRGYIRPVNPRHRMHTSTMVAYRNARVMIDCGESWLGKVEDLKPDAVVITHAHEDHAFGLENGSPCPVYATREAWDTIGGFAIPRDRRRTLRLRVAVRIGAISFEPFSVRHSERAPAVGYRITAGPVQIFYVPDVVSIDERSDALRGVAVYVGDGAAITRNMVRREKVSGSLIGHAPISRQLDWCREEGVRRMIVTHCGSDIVGHAEGSAIAKVQKLGAERGVAVTVAHDGMETILRRA
jgi:phosphoribosyl 1,2-cyclic phosphodiesterase